MNGLGQFVVGGGFKKSEGSKHPIWSAKGEG
jgi:hypothetical protein